VDLNVSGTGGGNVLGWAVMNGDLKLVNALVVCEGIDVNTTDSDFQTPLKCAIYKDAWEIFEVLLACERVIVNACEGLDVNAPGYHHGPTALHTAARCSSPRFLESLLAREQINVNPRDWHGKTPLMEAARCCCEEAVSLLLGHPDVDVNVVDEMGKTALDHAMNAKGIWPLMDQGKYDNIIRLLQDHPQI
jgi:ankyrin repeat protein